MEEKLKELYLLETGPSGLDFSLDPEYRQYYTQAEALWEGGEMPAAVFHLLETANFLSFAHGFRLGLRLSKWARTD